MEKPRKHLSWWRRHEDFVFVFRKRLQDVLIKTNMFALALCLQQTSSRRLGQDQYIRLGHTSSRRLAKTSARHLQDVLQIYLQHVFKTYHQVKLFLLTCLQEVFNTFLRRSFPKPVIYRGISLGNNTFEKFIVSTKFAREIKNSQVLVLVFRSVFRTWSNIYNSVFSRKVILKWCYETFRIIHKKMSFLIKLSSVDLQCHWKRDSSAGVFLWILQNL